MMKSEFTAIGKRIPQVDAPLKASGEVKYMVDIKLPKMLVGKVLRSPYAHARIKRIDKTKAEKIPGVEAVISWENTLKIPYFLTPEADVPRPSREYFLTDKARYVGDPIAAVAAVDERTAEEALQAIKVEYEELSCVTNPKDAMKPGAPRLYDDAENNIAGRLNYPFVCGDVEKGLQESDLVIEENFSVPYQIQAHMETHCAIANVDLNGKVTCYSPNQFPFMLRMVLSMLFDIPIGKINVVGSFIGGSFGCRTTYHHNEPIAVALSLKTHKPVKVEYSMEEDFTCLCYRGPHEYIVKMGFKKNGTLHAFKINNLSWADPFGRGMGVGFLMLCWGLGHYRCANVGGECLGAYTNTPRIFAMRGAGNPEIMWGVEQVMDMAANKLGINPLEIRLKNIKKVGEPFSLGPIPIESTYLEDCIKTGAETIDWHIKSGQKQKGSKKRGVGMATMSHCSGAYPFCLEHSGAIVNFNEDGSINLTVYPANEGQHIWGALSQIAAEELEIQVEDVHIVTGETEKCLWDIGSHASRSAYVTGNAVLNAAKEAKEKLLQRSSSMIGSSPDQLEIKDKKVYIKANPDRWVFVSEVVQDAMWGVKDKGEATSIEGECSFASTAGSPPTAAFFAEVEVDTETGEVKVLKFTMVADCGTVINPMSVEGQCEGAIQQGIGYALTEKFVYNKKSGFVESDNFTTYKMPGSLDMPETKIITINKPDPKGPFGAKGIGEPGIVGVAPAIGNAIFNAVGIRIRDLPITPEKVLKALKEKQLNHEE